MTRRTLLRSAAGAAIASQLGWLTACGSSDSSPGGDLGALADQLSGRLLLPGDSDFSATAPTWNLEFESVQPLGIAQCASAEDVQAAVRWARETETPAVARSGGHSYAGYSTTPGLLVDVGPLSSVNVDQSTGLARLGAGAQLGDVDNDVAPFGVTVPAGRCPTVGIAGLVLGGGFGFSARKFGLTSDNLVETSIVTADGELLVCNEREHADLFWALRGGGGGNFGINVDFTFHAREVDTAAFYNLSWTGYDQATAVWAAMQEVAAAAPVTDFSMELGIFVSEPTGDSGAERSLRALGQLFGSEEELRDLLAPALEMTTPSSVAIQGGSFASVTQELAATNLEPDAFLSKSNYLPGPIDDAGVEILVEEMNRFPEAARAAEFKIFTWGGAIADLAPDATAFAHRDAAFVNEGSSSWRPGASASLIEESKAWIEQLYERMSRYLADRSYQNFIDPTLRDWERAYYGENLARLVEVKRTYDPDDFFRFPQSIPLAT